MSRCIRWVRALALIALILLPAISAEEFNGTSYRLTSDQVEVVQPINASSLSFILKSKADNMTLLDAGGKNVKISSSYTFWGGNYKYNLDFGRHISGKLIYTLPYQGQQFILPTKEGRPVRVILPPGYTTGDRLLGIATPAPDDIREDKDGTVLTWRNISGQEVIDISYYKNSAPEALKMIFTLISIAALILIAEYYASIRRLRSIRKNAEKSMKY